MKATEVRAMSVEQLNEKLTSLKKDLFFLRMQHATNQLTILSRSLKPSVILPASRP